MYNTNLVHINAVFQHKSSEEFFSFHEKSFRSEFLFKHYGGFLFGGSKRINFNLKGLIKTGSFMRVLLYSSTSLSQIGRRRHFTQFLPCQWWWQLKKRLSLLCSEGFTTIFLFDGSLSHYEHLRSCLDWARFLDSAKREKPV